MKKLLFLATCVFITLLTSCSSDDNKSDVNYISAKFNGVQQKFNIISVDIIDYEGYSDIEVSGTMNSDNSKRIDIKSEYGVTGNNIIWGVYYTLNGSFYEIVSENFNSSITENSSGKYKGTFSGSVINDEGVVIEITEGDFNILY